MHFAFHGVNLAGRRVSSPRARGCSLEEGRRPAPGFVFPACAGVFLCAAQRAKKVASLPRVRGGVSGLCNAVVGVGMVFPACAGGVPFRSLICAALSESSPRVRGCSEAASSCPCRFAVFPACAGVFRSDRTSGGPPSVFPACAGVFPTFDTRRANLRFPRVCGGVPGKNITVLARQMSSPRVCGGVPTAPIAPHPSRVSSPRVRGCFRRPRPVDGLDRCLLCVRGGVPVRTPTASARSPVFPACAGVFRSSLSRSLPRWMSPLRVRGCSLRKQDPRGRLSGLPRVRGGVPVRHLQHGRDVASSPHMRE